MSKLNNYFVLIFNTHISLKVCRKQKDIIRKSTNICNLRRFVKALKNLTEVLPKNQILTCITHFKIIKRLERNENIKIIKIIKFPVEIPLIIEKLQIGNKNKLLKKEEIYYIKFIIEE